jgi:predicted nucleic acid-binding protein
LIAYIDASVLLRVVLGDPGALAEWGQLTRGVASALLEVECVRALDRIRLEEGRPEGELSVWRQATYALLEKIDQVEVTRAVLARAAQPLPTVLATLDAIHLATALGWREASGEELVMATHDSALARAARAHGFEVVGA